jgi:uncharacterized GH25 family protein
MKKIILLFLVCLLSLIVLAHEFWLQPHKFYFTIREVANIRFRVGEHFTGDNWTGNKEKIQQLVHYTPSGETKDIASELSGNKGDSLQVPLREEGTHMVIFNSTNSFISLAADTFNAYLGEDGLDQPIRYRLQHGENGQKGNEYYQRSVKTIFQVGGKITDDCLKPSSLPLDIIPDENPYAVPYGTDSEKPVKVRFQVLFNKKPLADVLVKTWYHTSGKQVKMDTLRTNRRGWITAERHPGPFMVSCVYMERNRPDSAVQWQSYWSSLCFEYSRFYPGKTGGYQYQKNQK